MTREQVTKIFPDATDAQITNFLNQSNSEIAKERTKADQYRQKSEKADELQSKLDEIENNNLSEIEQANKNLEKANARIAELEKAQRISSQRATVATNFKVTAEQAEKIVDGEGNIDYEFLGQIIAGKESAAAKAKEQEIAAQTINPGGTQATGSDEKAADVKNAEAINFGRADAAEQQAAKNYYK